MEITLKQGAETNLTTKIIDILTGLELSSIKKTIFDAFENLSNNDLINYIGELNKNDVMH